MSSGLELPPYYKMSRRDFLAGVSMSALIFAIPINVFAQEKKLTGPFKTLQELDASLAAANVENAERKKLLELAKPCAALVSVAADDSDISIGASKIGGAPDLPRGMPWPVRGPTQQDADREKEILEKNDFSGDYRKKLEARVLLAQREAPLTFIIQVDFADVAKAGELDPDIPRDGRLSIFYDLILKPWRGADIDGTARFTSLYITESRDRLVRHVPPDLGEPIFGEEEYYKDFRNQLPPARLTPKFTFTLPDTGSMPYMTYYPRGKKVEHEDWMYDSPTHLNATNRVGGWPENIQGDMAVEIAAEYNGIDLPYGSERYWKVAEEIQHLADEWVHLLQFGDYDNKIMDFDGLFHVWIKRDHLKARDFSKTKLIFRTS